jgi:hypothetical protein
MRQPAMCVGHGRGGVHQKARGKMGPAALGGGGSLGERAAEGGWR